MRRSLVVAGVTAAALAAGVLGAVPAAQASNTEQAVVVSDDPANFTPDVLGGRVYAIAQVGTRMIIGGDFTQVRNPGGGTVFTRLGHLAAFDATTGEVDPAFNPALDGIVHSLEAFGTSVFVGGEFDNVGGVFTGGLTRLNSVTGSRDTAFVATLNPAPTGNIVNSLVVRGNRLYVGGVFGKVNGVTRANLAALNASTGALDTAFNLAVTGTRVTGERTGVQVVEVSASGSTMVISGNFTAVGPPGAAQSRNQIAVILPATNSLSTWATTEYSDPCKVDSGFNAYVRGIDFAPDGSYFVVVTSGGSTANTLCDAVARWENGRTGSGQLPTWVDFSGGDSLTAVAVTGTTVYVGGHQRWLNNSAGNDTPKPGAVDRDGLAALDPLTGLPFAWNPGRDRGEGVFDLLATPSGLWVGSDTDGIGTPRETRARIAFFPIQGGTAIKQPVPASLPNNLYLAQNDGSLDKRQFTGTSVSAATAVSDPGSVPWATVTGAFMLAGRVYYSRPDGSLWYAPFNGSTVGAATSTGTWFDFTGVQGMTFNNGRLYYVNGDGKLYYRWFTPSTNIIGSQELVAAASGYADAHALFFGPGTLYYAKADNNLYKVAVSSVNGAPSGAATAVATPGVTWDVPAAFLNSDVLKQFARIYGSDRIVTSVAASEDLFGPGAADAVVLARADVFADGLPGAPLAANKNGPLLLTGPTALDGRTLDEIKRVLPAGKTVYLLGGTGALSSAVESAIKAVPGKNYQVTRLQGADRYATAVEIAKQVTGKNKALLATGTDFPDALGAGAAAGANSGVVLLTKGSVLPPSVKTYLTVTEPTLKVWAVGGPAATAAGSLADFKIIGTDRYDTAAKLAIALFPAPSRAVLATGTNFPDGLSGGGYAANQSAPLLLVTASALPSSTASYLAARQASINGGAVFGGPLVIGEPVVRAAELTISG